VTAISFAEGEPAMAQPLGALEAGGRGEVPEVADARQ